MVFAVNGMVKWKGKKLANGIDGKFETNDERVIKRLQTLGFREFSVVQSERDALTEKKETIKPEQKKPKRTKK